jgi:proteic killer suppression protein
LVVKSFRHNGLKRFFATGDGRKVQPKHLQRLRLILTMLNAATHAGQMNAPGLGFHPLKGKPQGRFAVSVDENFRVVFRFEGGHAVDVDYTDYH